MKMAFVLIAALLASQVAFAETFVCESLRDAQGNTIFGGPAYQLIENGSEVTLVVSNGTVAPNYHRSVEYPMTKVSQGVDDAIYEAQGIRATFVYLNGERVNITRGDVWAPCYPMER